MKVTAIKTPIISPGDNLEQVLAHAVPTLSERSVVVVASKIVSTCENQFVAKTDDPKQKYQLVTQEAEWYMEPNQSKYGTMLTIKRNWIFAYAGIDESNADHHYILWPRDPQRAVNSLWRFLRRHYHLQEVGVTMSDSASLPLNWGVTGHAIAYCGFNPLRSYIGKPDLFGRVMRMEQVNVMQSVTVAASLEMGEGDESTPIGIVEDVAQMEFQDHEPTQQELHQLHIAMEEDVFAPLLTAAQWKKGQASS